MYYVYLFLAFIVTYWFYYILFFLHLIYLLTLLDHSVANRLLIDLFIPLNHSNTNFGIEFERYD